MKNQPAISSSPQYKISLAEWSLHLAIQNGEMRNIDFPRIARTKFDIGAVEYVSQLFEDASCAEDKVYLQKLKNECEKYNVVSHLIMIDFEGNLGDLDIEKRNIAVENHYKWVTAAKFLGCLSVRVNAHGEGTSEEVHTAFVDGLGKLCDFAANYDINVIVENHGGYSSDPEWVTSVIKTVNKTNCGLLPDFGNFPKDTDIYQAIEEMMPYAKGVSAKSYEFDSYGDEIKINYKKMLETVKKSKYDGYIGIEYEGVKLSEIDGIRATMKLIENCYK